MVETEVIDRRNLLEEDGPDLLILLLALLTYLPYSVPFLSAILNITPPDSLLCINNIVVIC